MNYNDKLAKLAVRKSLLKEYKNSSNERIVYMDDGTEFQIQIFNPYTYTIGVSFGFNSNYQSNSNLLVLRPGERVWLDRYLDNESRLLFSTYEVGNSMQVKEAIKDNGNLSIKFYKEKEHRTNWYNNNIYVMDAINTQPWKGVDVYYNNNLGSSICADSAINYCDCSLSLDSVKGSPTTFANTVTTGSAASSTYTSASATYDASINTATYDSVAAKPRSKSIETGRIEEGSHSNQKFTNVYKDFESWPFKTEYIKILPTSQKQINSNDLKKRYCHECGRKLNQKYKFCPYCGAAQ